VVLPEAAQAEEAEARYVNGVLTVAVPKAEEAKAMTVKAGEHTNREAAGDV
jgi:HSP20 family molecular chaperone IbpA